MATILDHASGSRSAGIGAFGGNARPLAAIFLLLAAYAAVVAPLADVPLSEFIAVASRFLLLATVFAAGIWVLVRLPELIIGRTTPWTGDRWMWFAGACLLTGLTLPLFGLFKQMVLGAQGFPLDPLFARADRMLFGGIDAWRITHAAFGSLAATKFIDGVYSSWLYVMFAFPMLVAATVCDAGMRARLIATWLLCWIVVGTLGAWLLASAGPVYYDVFQQGPLRFADLVARLDDLDAQAAASGGRFDARTFHRILLAAHSSRDFAPAGGISAMPSVHVAMAILFAVGARYASRLLAMIAWTYAMCIWVGSVHLGWHYALDGVVSALLVGAIWWGTGRLFV